MHLVGEMAFAEFFRYIHKKKGIFMLFMFDYSDESLDCIYIKEAFTRRTISNHLKNAPSLDESAPHVCML